MIILCGKMTTYLAYRVAERKKFQPAVLRERKLTVNYLYKENAIQWGDREQVLDRKQSKEQ